MSSSPASSFANVAWGVNLDVGLVLDVITEFDLSARAMRGGS